MNNIEAANRDRELICSKFIETERCEDGCLKELSFKNVEKFNFAFDIVDALAEKYPDETAMVHLSVDMTERRFTFKNISDEASRTANYFKSLGIKRGDRVMLVLKRNYRFWYSILALHKLGAIAIPATNQLQEHDYTYRFKAAEVSAVVCTASDRTPQQVDNAVFDVGMNITKIIADGTRDGWHSFDDEYKSFDSQFERAEDSPSGSDPMLMFFTSGTTGYPKMVTHTYTYPLGHYITARYWHNIKPGGLHFTISDTGWGKAMWGKLYGQWLCEAAIFVYDFDRFHPAEVLPMFKKYNISTFCAPPTIYRMLIKEDIGNYDLTSIKHATTAGEALNPAVLERFKEITGLEVMEGFGQTESTLMIGNIVGSKPKFGSMGKPVPTYDVRLVRPDGTECDAGENGEIVVYTEKSTPCGLFDGYYNDAELTSSSWHDGIYHTGDVAYIDEDGYYWYVGRLDDIIKSSGYRISPVEIENVIMELPYVLECGVSSEPDEIRGRVVKASVVLTKGTEPSEELKRDIQTYVKTNTAPYKYPRIVVFRDELPKTISGKVIRNKL